MRKFSIFLALFTLLFSCTIFAEEINTNLIFTNEEVNTIMENMEDRNLTIFEMNEKLSNFFFTQNTINYENDKELASNKDFLNSFIAFSNGRYIQKVGDRIVYPAKDSIWLSSEEWQRLNNYLSEPVSLSTVQIMINRTKQANAFLKQYKVPTNAEDFTTVIKSFFNEFSEIAETNQPAIKYWLNPDGDEISIWLSSYFSTIMHELIHETSARKSHAFQNREINDQGWFVYWSTIPSTLYYFDLLNEEWVKVSGSLSVPNGRIIRDEIPQEIKEGSYNELYSDNDTSAYNIQGLYGMMYEMNSYAAEIGINLTQSSIDYQYNEMSLSKFTPFYYQAASILEYLDKLEETSPSTYKRIISDKKFTDLFFNLCIYVKRIINNVEITSTNSETDLHYKWFKDCLEESKISYLRPINSYESWEYRWMMQKTYLNQQFTF